MDEQGHHQTQVTHTPYDKIRISWYPDGKHVLVGSRQQGVRKVSIATGVEEEIKLPWQKVSDVMLSSDGKQITFSVSPMGGVDVNHIWVATAAGTNLKKLTTKAYLQHQPVWGPNNQWIYFLAGDGGQSHDIWKVSVDGQHMEKLTSGNLYHFELAVSKNNTFLFSSNRSGNYEIWSQAPGKKAVKQTHHAMLDSQPDWSPLADAFVFTSNRNGGQPNIWLKNIETGKLSQLTQSVNGAMSAVWYKYEK